MITATLHPTGPAEGSVGRLQAHERLEPFGVLDVEDPNVGLFGHVDLLGVVHDVLEVLLRASTRISPMTTMSSPSS